MKTWKAGAFRLKHLILWLQKRTDQQDDQAPLDWRFLEEGFGDYRFSFYVVSAAPEEVIQSALEGLIPPDHIFGTQFRYNQSTGEIDSIVRVPAGYGCDLRPPIKAVSPGASPISSRSGPRTSLPAAGVSPSKKTPTPRPLTGIAPHRHSYAAHGRLVVRAPTAALPSRLQSCGV